MARNLSIPPSVKPGIPKLGNMPKGWTKVTFGDVLDVVQRTANLEDDVEYQLIVAKRNRGGIVPRERLRGSDVLTKTQFYVRGGDFLISKRQIVHGACGIVPDDLGGAVVSNEYTSLCGRNGFSLEFLRHYTHSIHFQQTCFHASVGVAIEKMIFRLNDWLKHSFYLPQSNEQKKIAGILSTWDHAIEQAGALIAAKRELKKGVMQQLLTGKRRFPEFGEPAVEGKSGKQTKAGWIPEDWECSPLGDKIRTFSGGTPSRNDTSLFDGDIPWIKSGELNNKYIASTNEHISKVGLEESAAKFVEPDTLLYALYGATAGIPAFSKIRATINQAILAIIPKKGIDTVYLYFWFEHSKEHLLKKYTQGGQPNLSANLVKGFNIPLPPLSEQEKIASILTAYDNEIDALKKIASQYAKQKKGLMQQLLTGKVRVKETGASA